MSKNVTIKLDEDALQKARAAAKRERRSLSAQVAVWISEAATKAASGADRPAP
ncbi:MAG: TA system antitoxin ParD family protein [Aeromonas sp.]